MVSDLRKICRGYEITSSGNKRKVLTYEIKDIAERYNGSFPIELSKSFIDWLVSDIGGDNEITCHLYLPNVFNAYDLVEDSYKKIDGLNLMIGDSEMTIRGQELFPNAFYNIRPRFFSSKTTEETTKAIQKYRKNKLRQIVQNCHSWNQEREEVRIFNDLIGNIEDNLMSVIEMKIGS